MASTSKSTAHQIILYIAIVSQFSLAATITVKSSFIMDTNEVSDEDRKEVYEPFAFGGKPIGTYL